MADKTSEYNSLKLSEAFLDILSPYYRGASAKSGGRFTGQQYRNNANLRLREGQREAMDIKRVGRQMVSDATVAMVNQGGMVDHSMLSRLKREHDINAINAMYDAKADALQQRYAADAAERQGEREYRAGVIGMTSNILSAASSFNWGGDPPKVKRITKMDRGY